MGCERFEQTSKHELSTIREKVVVIQKTADDVWDVIKRSPIVAPTGTVERNLKNLGKITITAEPHSDNTVYLLQSARPIFDDDLIIKLSKETELEQKEKELFGDIVPAMRSPLPTRLEVLLSSTKPSLCSKYMSLFLKWLDSTYFQAMPKREDFEESIEV